MAPLAVPTCTRAAIHLNGRVVSLRSRAALASSSGRRAPASGQLGLMPAPLQWLERFLVEGLQPAPFHLPPELLTPRCGVLPNAVLAQHVVHAHGARHEPNHVRPPPASQTPKTSSPPLPPLSGRSTRTNLRFDLSWLPSKNCVKPGVRSASRMPRYAPLLPFRGVLCPDSPQAKKGGRMEDQTSVIESWREYWSSVQ